MDEQARSTQFHIACGEGDVGKYCILPGDPGRCEKIAAHFENPVHIVSNREFTVYTGTLCGEKVSAVSTGIGGPSAAIALEELCNLGAHTFLRVGTCGGIRLDVKSGDIVVATGAVRMEGTSREYAPLAFPAVSNFDCALALRDSAKALDFPVHTGVVQSKDSFYGQHSPARMPIAQQLEENWTAWKRLGVLASEMETAALFTVGASRGVRCGAAFHVLWNQERENEGLESGQSHDTSDVLRVVVQALETLIQQDRGENSSR